MPSSMSMRGTDHYQFAFVNPSTFTICQLAEREQSRVSWVTEFELPICFV